MIAHRLSRGKIDNVYFLPSAEKETRFRAIRPASRNVSRHAFFDWNTTDLTVHNAPFDVQQRRL
jgi:hypothetical protein